MSITGDLTHFPIIDIIQLLHGTRNSGVLRISSEKGENQLVFHNGNLVSANYLNSRVRIGQVLVSAGAITDEQLTRALEIQKNDGKNRKPLVLTLLDNNMIDEQAACSGIEALIEMTIVEVLTWKSGRFALDAATGDNVAGYRFSPAKFQQQILLNAHKIVMESLRIFDEKVRDGTMDEICSISGLTSRELGPVPSADNPDALEYAVGADGSSTQIGASLQLFAEQRKKIQSGGDPGYRAAETVKRLVNIEFPSATPEQKQYLAKFFSGSLKPLAGGSDVPAAVPRLAVVVITKSPLLSTMVKSVCHYENIYAVSSDDGAAVNISIRLLLCQNLHPVILVDMPHSPELSGPAPVYQEYLEYLQSSVVLVACPHQWGRGGLQALAAGVRSVVPRPCSECGDGSHAQQALAFCRGLGSFLRTLAPELSRREEQAFFNCLSRLRNCRTSQEIWGAVLALLMDTFERAIVLRVLHPFFVAELSFGVIGGKSDGPTDALELQIPFDDQPIFQEVLLTGQLYYGFHSDSTCQHELYRGIGMPENPEVLLFPLVRANKVVAVIYADFGSRQVYSPSLGFLEALVQFTTAQISVLAYRQKLKSMLEARAGKDCG